MKIYEILTENSKPKRRIRKTFDIRPEYGGGYTEFIFDLDDDKKVEGYEVKYFDKNDNNLVGHELKDNKRTWFDRENPKPDGSVISPKLSDQQVQNNFEKAILP